VPIAVALALPALWLGGLAILAACWPLRKPAAAARASTDERSTDRLAGTSPATA
jgi:hypothetical protein